MILWLMSAASLFIFFVPFEGANEDIITIILAVGIALVFALLGRFFYSLSTIRICSACNHQFARLESRYSIKDGEVCAKCLISAGFSPDNYVKEISMYLQTTTDEIRALFEAEKPPPKENNASEAKLQTTSKEGDLIDSHEIAPGLRVSFYSHTSSPLSVAYTVIDYIDLEAYRILKKSFVAVDVETTGLSPNDEKIIEVCAIKYENGIETDRLSSLINPAKKIPSRASRVNQITDDMVADAPAFRDIAEKLYDFLDGRTLAAHNARFDMGFLKAEFSRCGYTFDFSCADTLAIARTLFGLSSYKLQSVLDHMGISRTVQHRGASDCEGCAAILLHALKVFENGCKEKLVSNHMASIQANIKAAKEQCASEVVLTFDNVKGFYFATHNGAEVGRLPKSANKGLRGHSLTVPIDEITQDENGKHSVVVNLIDAQV